MTERGLVTSVSSRSVQVQVETHGEIRCTLRAHLWTEDAGQSKPVAVGDRVNVVLEESDGDFTGAVESIEPRTNALARPRLSGKRGQQQVVAANIDRLIIVTALADPPFRPGLVDRLLVAAASRGIPAMLCLNKIDLAGRIDVDQDSGVPPDRSVVQPYRDAGYRVVETSCPDAGAPPDEGAADGVRELAAIMSKGVSLLVGHSGVGKSSLVNEISPGLKLHTSHVAEHGRGRHTTTKAVLLPLVGGGFVVDSPGIREFGLTEVEPADAARLFPGFDELPDACRFSNCLHKNEPKCAVLAAIDAGEYPRERYESYLRMLEGIDTPVQW